MQSQVILKHLIEIGAVKLDFEKGFQWVSGINSPIYCDNRMLISSVEGRRAVVKAFADKIKKEYPNCEWIAGTATAGIPHAAWLAEELSLPMIYVRSKPKEHGTKSLIEGFFKKAARCILIEDLISTGKSSIAAAQALKEEGLKVLSVGSIFNYELKKAEKAFNSSGFEYFSLAGVEELISFSQSSGAMSAEQADYLRQFFTKLGN